MSSNQRACDAAWSSFANSEPAPTHKDCFYAGWVARKGAIETGDDRAKMATRLLRSAHNELTLDPDNQALAARIREWLDDSPAETSVPLDGALAVLHAHVSAQSDANLDIAFTRISAEIARLRRAHDTSGDVFSRFQIGTIFQKKENGNIVALTPEGGNTVIPRDETDGDLLAAAKALLSARDDAATVSATLQLREAVRGKPIPSFRGKPCTCDNCLGSSVPCRVEAGERLGELWYCRKAAESPLKAGDNHG